MSFVPRSQDVLGEPLPGEERKPPCEGAGEGLGRGDPDVVGPADEPEHPHADRRGARVPFVRERRLRLVVVSAVLRR